MRGYCGGDGRKKESNPLAQREISEKQDEDEYHTDETIQTIRPSFPSLPL
jgi:hypothetical protein